MTDIKTDNLLMDKHNIQLLMSGGLYFNADKYMSVFACLSGEDKKYGTGVPYYYVIILPFIGDPELATDMTVIHISFFALNFSAD